MRAGVVADRRKLFRCGTLLQGSSPPWDDDDDDDDDELELGDDFDADELGLDPEEPYDA